MGITHMEDSSLLGPLQQGLVDSDIDPYMSIFPPLSNLISILQIYSHCLSFDDLKPY